MGIPKFLIERYQFWKKNTFEDYKDIYQQASKIPQRPIAMIITCCDSRILENSLFQMTTKKSLKKIFDINFFSQFFLTQIYLKLLNNSKNGSIVFVSSNSSIDNPIGRVAYSSSKAAINSLAVTLSRESGVKNLRVNAILPGLTNTKMANNFTKKEAINEYINNVSLKRIAQPDEISNVITFLCSDNSSFINGQLIKVDGGR